MDKWEYDIIFLGKSEWIEYEEVVDAKAEFNRRGNEGWELAAVIGWHAVFKRPVPEPIEDLFVRTSEILFG